MPLSINHDLVGAGLGHDAHPLGDKPDEHASDWREQKQDAERIRQRARKDKKDTGKNDKDPMRHRISGILKLFHFLAKRCGSKHRHAFKQDHAQPGCHDDPRKRQPKAYCAPKLDQQRDLDHNQGKKPY